MWRGQGCCHSTAVTFYQKRSRIPGWWNVSPESLVRAGSVACQCVFASLSLLVHLPQREPCWSKTGPSRFPARDGTWAVRASHKQGFKLPLVHLLCRRKPWQLQLHPRPFVPSWLTIHPNFHHPTLLAGQVGLHGLSRVTGCGLQPCGHCWRSGPPVMCYCPWRSQQGLPPAHSRPTRFKLPLYPMAKLSPIRDPSLAPGQLKAKQAGLEPLHVSGWSTRQSSHGKPGSHVGSPPCILSSYLRREPTRLSFNEQSPSFLQTSWDSQWPCSQAVYLVFCASDPRTGVPDVWFKWLTTQGGVFYTFTEMIT